MRTWLALGDSYTIGESVPNEDRFVNQAIKKLKQKGIFFEEPVLIAKTGWTSRDLLTAIKERNLDGGFDLVTLLIGVNNQYQGKSIEEYTMEFAQLLRLATELAGNNASHLIVLSIPDYSLTPFAKDLNQSDISRQIDSFNATNREIAEKNGVHYLEITDGSRIAAHVPGSISGDGLHYSGKEYERWACGLVEMIERMFPPY